MELVWNRATLKQINARIVHNPNLLSPTREVKAIFYHNWIYHLINLYMCKLTSWIPSGASVFWFPYLNVWFKTKRQRDQGTGADTWSAVTFPVGCFIITQPSSVSAYFLSVLLIRPHPPFDSFLQRVMQHTQQKLSLYSLGRYNVPESSWANKQAVTVKRGIPDSAH